MSPSKFRLLLAGFNLYCANDVLVFMGDNNFLRRICRKQTSAEIIIIIIKQKIKRNKNELRGN